ncbi:MAG TPA: TIGR03086 family metal-binding protein [Pseudonocardia sp.]|nr:TIGR03086 family metal-binding protein [Pseudonocardia sp.]
MIDLIPARDTMIDLLSQVAADQFAHATPCSEYTVADLIDHVDGVSVGFAALARGDELPDASAPSTAAPDWRDSVTKHVWALGEAWADPTAWQGSTDAGGLELPNELWGKIALTELVVHGWDLAKATGQPFELAEPTVLACFEHVARFVPNAPVEGLWAPAVRVPRDAALLDRLVAITGRNP